MVITPEMFDQIVKYLNEMPDFIRAEEAYRIGFSQGFLEARTYPDVSVKEVYECWKRIRWFNKRGRAATVHKVEEVACLSKKHEFK